MMVILYRHLKYNNTPLAGSRSSRCTSSTRTWRAYSRVGYSRTASWIFFFATFSRCHVPSVARARLLDNEVPQTLLSEVRRALPKDELTSRGGVSQLCATVNLHWLDAGLLFFLFVLTINFDGSTFFFFTRIINHNRFTDVLCYAKLKHWASPFKAESQLLSSIIFSPSRSCPTKTTSRYSSRPRSFQIAIIM